MSETKQGGIEIALCDTGGVTKTDVFVCNLVEADRTSPILKKYEEAVAAYNQYTDRMTELQRLMELDLGKALIMVGSETPPGLDKLSERFGICIKPLDPGDAA